MSNTVVRGQIDGRVAVATAGVVVNGSPGVSQ